MEWPANSPDLNLIKHIWPRLKTGLYTKRHAQRRSSPRAEHSDELGILLNEALIAQKQWLLQDLLNSMLRRAQAVINALGGHIDSWSESPGSSFDNQPCMLVRLGQHGSKACCEICWTTVTSCHQCARGSHRLLIKKPKFPHSWSALYWDRFLRSLDAHFINSESLFAAFWASFLSTTFFRHDHKRQSSTELIAWPQKAAHITTLRDTPE